uniref:Uncharacterized protein n=1 Tax=Anopheles quadriannulatus TaxID=34691 RepID=A0A182XT22_ANOQN
MKSADGDGRMGSNPVVVSLSAP